MQEAITRTQTSVVLKFFYPFLSYFKILSRTQTSVVLKLVKVIKRGWYIYSNPNKCCIEIELQDDEDIGEKELEPKQVLY